MAIFELILSILVLFLSSIFICFYFYFTRNFKFWHKLGVPYVKPTLFVGSLKECLFQKVTIGVHLKNLYDEHSDKPYVGIFWFDKPGVLIRDIELVKNILVKDSQNFIDRNFSADENVEPILGRSIFTSKGNRWRYLRRQLTRIYTFGKIKTCFNLVDNCGKELADYLQRATADGSPVAVMDAMSRYTTDVIASSAFGINGHALKDPQAEFWFFLRRIFDFSVRKGLAILIEYSSPALTRILKLKFLDDVTTNYLRKTIWSTVDYREKNGIKRNDFLDQMMELRKKGKKDDQERASSANNQNSEQIFQIDGDDFVAMAFTVLIASFDTSGNTLSFALYETALHPDIQHKLRAEILNVLKKHDGQLTFDGIQEMTYLDMVVSETMRIYPILPFLDRKNSNDYELPNPTGKGTINLPAGTGIFIPLLAFQNDPTYFPEPEKFDPERFTEENKRSRPKNTYMPFGDGPRMCLGLQFGLLQVKTALCHILSRFEVAPCKDTPVPIVFDTKSFELKSDREIWLSFKRIEV